MKRALLCKKVLSAATRVLMILAILLTGLSAFAQVTTAIISGEVKDKNGEGLIGATVVATHTPSGTRYGTVTNASGRYQLPAVRVGGPFSVVVSYTGYEAQTRNDVYTSLGTATNVNVSLAETGVTMNEVVISANRSDLFSSDRTGAASTFSKAQINSVPVIGSRSISEITKYNPNGNGRSFGGQDSRLNNFTIDGSQFNNGFGLGNDANAGGRTGTTPISLDALEEVQVNVAPYDVRQSGFTGSGINAVTRSGTNEVSGSVYYSFRDTSNLFIGKTNYFGKKSTITNFNNNVFGARLGGAIIKNKLFYFVSYERERRVSPATPFVANGSTGGIPTRVLKNDLDSLSGFLKRNFGYETGAYQGFDFETKSDKFLVRLDYNISDAHKLTLRYTHHNSEADQPISNSNSLGFGNRTLNTDAMAYQNSGYIIGDNTRSIVAELNSTIGDHISNKFIAGYDFQDENRVYKGALFPTIDILKDGKTYIGAGFDPFTPSNKLNYATTHFTDNVTFFTGKHTVTVGANYEYYQSKNLFFPGSNGVYVFNSLNDFYAAASSKADTSPVKLNLFQFRYSALPGAVEPLQILKAHKTDVYGQDEFQVAENFKLTAGIRVSAIWFAQTSLSNSTVDGQDYISNEGTRAYKITTGKLPETKILFEPRLGFNLDVFKNQKTQIRGGTGIFTGRPPYVFLSNQIGNNGVLTGFIQQANSTKYKFTPDASTFIPEKPTLPSTFDIAATDKNFKYPQVWKSNLAIDQKLPLGFVLTVEGLYNKNINAVNYFDANLEPTTGATFAGPDNRPRFPGSGLTGPTFNNAIRINDNISRAAILNSKSAGYYYSGTVKLEYPQRKGLYGMVAYTYSKAKNLMSAGSIASGSWTGARSTLGNNSLSLSYADQDIPHRIVAILNYRIEYGSNFGGATQFSLGYVGEKSTRASYAYAGDMNGDGVTNNDLIFVPNKASDLTFEQFNVGTDTFTTAKQAIAYDKFIDQDGYLKNRRGKYAERNGVIFPWLHRFDFSVAQDFYVKVGGKKNAIQVRFDILNVGNLLNNEWGVNNFLTADRPLTYRSVSADGTPKYRMATQVKDGKTVLLTDTFQKSTALSQAWAAQLTIRYTFN